MRFRSLIGTLVCFTLALTVAACGGDNGSPTGPSGGGGGGTPADVTIRIVGMIGSQSYSPNPASVRAGQTVAWRNDDSVVHTATADAAGGFNTGSIAPGATSSPITMGTAGSFGYHCTFHPTMVGTLTVTQ